MPMGIITFPLSFDNAGKASLDTTKLIQIPARRRELVANNISAYINLFYDKNPALPRKASLTEVDVTMSGGIIPISIWDSDYDEYYRQPDARKPTRITFLFDPSEGILSTLYLMPVIDRVEELIIPSTAIWTRD